MRVLVASGYFDKQAKKIVLKAIEETQRRKWLVKLSMSKPYKNNLDDIKAPLDIYHCHSGYSLESIKKAHEIGAKVILQRDSAHSEVMRDLVEADKEKWRKQYKGICSPARSNPQLTRQLKEYELTDYLLLASHWEEETFLKKGYPKEKIKIIPFTVDSEVFKPINHQNRRFSVCLGGNMCIRKGYPYAKEACKKIDTPLNVLSGFKFEEMPRELNKHTICLAPTVEDGYPHQVLSSMSCGLVPILSKNNGVKDLIVNRKNGFIVDINDDNVIDQIAHILAGLRAEPERMREIGMRARKTVSKRTWKDYSNEICKVYKEVMK